MKKVILSSIILFYLFSCSHVSVVRSLSSSKSKKIRYPVTKTIRYASSLRIFNRDGKYVVVKKAPALSWKEAHEMAVIIYKYSRKYGIDWKLMIAVFRQESDFNIKARNGKGGLRSKTSNEISIERKKCFDKHQEMIDKATEEITHKGKKEQEAKEYVEICLDKIQPYVKDRIYFDIGIGQINWISVDLFNFNMKKIETDLEYSIWAAFRVMKDKEKFKTKEPDNWWTRYNAKGSSIDKRQKYYNDVMRFYYNIYEDEDAR